jgi:adenylate cyclase
MEQCARRGAAPSGRRERSRAAPAARARERSSRPTFAPGYSALALAQLQAAAVYQKLGLEESQVSAERLARRAVSLDGADAEARSCLGWALQARGELEGAIVEIERALVMSPNLALAHWQRGATLIFSGRLKEGLDALETCIRLDPRGPFTSVRLLNIACGLYFAREYERVVDAAKRLIRSYPDFPMIYRWPAAALGQLGRFCHASRQPAHWRRGVSFRRIGAR